mmetsp:Transcript_116331/g.202283  ORF Transcript_116331/g.202283 Transcript_116331/m.202283 type:complete len:94 (-) Transcript_116331:1572-1853(-)
MGNQHHGGAVALKKEAARATKAILVPGVALCNELSHAGAVYMQRWIHGGPCCNACSPRSQAISRSSRMMAWDPPSGLPGCLQAYILWHPLVKP